MYGAELSDFNESRALSRQLHAVRRAAVMSQAAEGSAYFSDAARHAHTTTTTAAMPEEELGDTLEASRRATAGAQESSAPRDSRDRTTSSTPPVAESAPRSAANDTVRIRPPCADGGCSHSFAPSSRCARGGTMNSDACTRWCVLLTY
jgi:hypothetical protein